MRSLARSLPFIVLSLSLACTTDPQAIPKRENVPPLPPVLPVLAASGVHLEMRILPQTLEMHERASLAQSQIQKSQQQISLRDLELAIAFDVR